MAKQPSNISTPRVKLLKPTTIMISLIETLPGSIFSSFKVKRGKSYNPWRKITRRRPVP
jgi:hypothetical protein